MTYAKVLSTADQNGVFILHRMSRRSVLRFSAGMVSHLGGLTFVSALGIILLIGTRFNPLSYSYIACHLVTTAVAQFIKAKTGRKRPFQCFDAVCYQGPVLRDHSFPSGHTTAAFTSATVLSFFFPTLAVLLFLLAVLIGFSRIILGAHFPSDVIIGAVLGTSLSVLIVRLLG